MSGKIDNYTISINGDDKNLQLAVRNSVGGLNKVGRAANDANGGTKVLAGGFRNAATQAAAFEGPLGGVSGRLGAMASLLGNVNPLMVGMGLAVSGTTLFMISAIKEHDQLALRNKKQEALLKSTGHAAGFAAHELDTMAKAVALNTLASVEGIKDTQNVLLTFKGVAGDSFRDAITLSQDMAAVMGTDSKAAALQLGKALESPTQGISALKKAGVSFSQAEKDMIRDMEDAGRVADAQTFILETLKNQIGGAGNAEANTLSGAIDTLGQRWQSLKENVADTSGAASGMQAFVNGMAAVVHEIDQMIAPEDKSRLAELWVEKENLLTLMENTGARGSGARRTRLAAINKEAKEIEDRLAKNKTDAKVADDAAIANQKKNSDELIAQKKASEDKKTAATQAKYASDLSSMDMQFATETQKVELQNQKYLSRIEAWQLSDQEITARGFETMAELQESYRMMADEKLDADLLKIKEKNEKAEEDKTQKAKDEAEKRAKNEAAAQAAAYSAFQSTSGMFTSALKKSAGEKSAIYKIAFAAQQAAAIPGMIASTEEGATAALALGPIAGPAAAVGIRTMGYASVGLVAGQTIAGAFENGGIVGGSSYTGDNLTAFVNSSEMILNVGQQKKLFDMANGMAGSEGGGSAPIINIIEDASKAGQVSRSAGLTKQDVIDINVSNIVQQGEIAQAHEQFYGAERVGR